MSEHEQAKFFKEHAVRFERRFDANVEHVWQFLTNTTLLYNWYGEGAIEQRVGGAVSLVGGHIRGVVTQYKPFARLAYTWNVFNSGQTESDYPESHLLLELEHDGEKSNLILVHSPILERFEKQNAMGWHTFLDMLTAAVNGEDVKPRDEYMKKNAQLYGVDLAKLVP